MKIRLLLPCLAVPLLVPLARYAGMYQSSDCPLIKTFADDTERLNRSHDRATVRLLSRDRQYSVWKTPIGTFFAGASDTGQGLRNVISEETEDIYNTKRMVHPGDIVIDCGADLGTFTRVALNHGASTVVSIEPDPQKTTYLRETFAREIRDGRVVVMSVGVWNSQSITHLDGDKLSQSTGPVVRLVTIDSIVEELHLPKVDLIKMDIEGAEKPAIAGASDTITRYRPRFTIATEHFPDDFRAIPAALRRVLPTYVAQCGPCVGQFGRLQPYTMQFEAK